jgi:aconitate hydratase
MGVLPLEFLNGESVASHDLDGTETFDFEGIDDSIQPLQELTVRAVRGDVEKTFQVRTRIDSPVEVDYFKNGGILHTVLRSLLD